MTHIKFKSNYRISKEAENNIYINIFLYILAHMKKAHDTNQSHDNDSLEGLINIVIS